MRKLIVLVWLALVLVGCRTVSNLPFVQGGEPSLQSGSIVFAGIDGNLYATVGPDALVQLTTSTGGGLTQTVYSAYGWAGEKVVYATQELGPNQGITGAIYSVVPGHAPRRLLQRPGFAPFFLYPAPDNSRIAYLGSEAGQNGLVMGSIAVNGRKDLVHGIGQPFYAAWSPDSSTLVTHVGSPIGRSGSVMQLQSVNDMIVGEPNAPPFELTMGQFQAPAFSPDGRSIAIALTERGSATVAILTRGATEISHLAPLAGSAALAWSPDGNRLAYVDGEYAQAGGMVGKLWLANPSDRTVDLVSERATAFFWSPDSTKIIFFEPHIVGDGGSAALLYRLGVYSTYDGQSEFVAAMRPTPEFVQQVVPFFDQYHRAYTIWSPDSRLVVLNATDDRGVAVIHLLDTEKLRAGDAFSVVYRFPTQSRSTGGVITEEGFSSRVIAFGTVPFFNRDGAGISSPEPVRPGIDS